MEKLNTLQIDMYMGNANTRSALPSVSKENTNLALLERNTIAEDIAATMKTCVTQV